MKKQALILIGILIFLCGVALSFSISQQVITSVPLKDNSTISELQIPRIGIDTKVIKGGLFNGKWLLTDKYAQYYLPTNQSDFIIYAHDTQPLFGKLINIKPGDKIMLKKTNGQFLTYQVTAIAKVKPTETEKVNPQAGNEILLYTCNGIFDQYRLLVTGIKLQES